MKKATLYSTLLGLLLFTTSCKEDNSMVTPTISQEITEALSATIKDEFKAQTAYEAILNKFGPNTRPFVNIKKAEIKHAEAVTKVMTNYDLEVPKNDFKVEDMPVFQTVQEACEFGVEAEILNIELYDSFLSMDLPQDVQNVFESNRAASLNNHLPAFQNCSQ